MEVRMQQFIYGIGELIATHNLLLYVRNNTDDERIRMATGASMAGLGYVFGPDLEQRLRGLNDETLNENINERLVYAAGGAILGTLAGHALGPRVRLSPSSDLYKTIAGAQQDAQADRRRPGGLVTIASAGWLGYSLFFDGKTKEEQKRHLWGLGAGVIGYMYGPELLRKAQGLIIPQQAASDAKDIFRNGGALIGGVAGGILGWYKGGDIVSSLVRRPQQLAGPSGPSNTGGSLGSGPVQ